MDEQRRGSEAAHRRRGARLLAVGEKGTSWRTRSESGRASARHKLYAERDVLLAGRPREAPFRSASRAGRHQ